jgi:hypothetical protein
VTVPYTLTVRQGETYRIGIPVFNGVNEPISLEEWAGWTCRGQIRARATSPTVLYEWTAGDDLVMAVGEVQLTVPAEESSTWTWTMGRYDIEIIDPYGAVTRLIEGHVVVLPEITR